MKAFRPFLVVPLFAACLASAGHAQKAAQEGARETAQEEGPGTDLCGEDRFADREMLREGLIGLWKGELGPGYVIAGPTVIPHEADDREHFARIEYQGDGMVLIPSEGGVLLDLEWVEDETWRFDRDPALPEGVSVAAGTSLPILPYDSEALGARAGCPINDLPRLMGTGVAVIDGVRMEFTYRLMMVSHKQLAGFQEVTGEARGVPFLERRPIRMLMECDPNEGDC